MRNGGDRRAGFGRSSRRVSAVAALLLLVGSFLPPTLRTPAAAQNDGGVTALTGSLTITNPLILGNFSQPYVLLADLTPYVRRDRELSLPPGSQVIAPFDGDLADGASFRINLPIAPRGTINDVDGGEGDGDGVQLYSVEFAANAFGEPFAGALEVQGWGEALSSLVVTVGAAEVVGGQVVVWAPDDEQLFQPGWEPTAGS